MEQVASDRPRQSGDRLGRYVFVDRLGEGGMAEVWRAWDAELRRLIALKLVRSDQLATEADRERLRREARAMARLSHPNVLTVHDVGRIDDTDFIAMELARCTLGDWLAEAPRDRAAIVDVLVAAARGIAAAHRVGIVHRDIKPENILLGVTGEVKVSDFGIAGELDRHGIGADATVTGTPSYVAPELALGRAADARSDQFGFCVAAWRAVFGVRPFSTPDPDAVPTLASHHAAVLRGDLVRGAGPRAPAIERVLRRGLAVDPAARYPDLEALGCALAGTARSRPRRVGAGVAVVTLGVVAVMVMRSPATPAPTPVVLRPVGTIDDRRAPVFELARDGERLAIVRTGQRELEVMTLDGALDATYDLPPALAVDCLALGERGEPSFIGGRRDGRWEVWRSRRDGPAFDLLASWPDASTLLTAQYPPSLAVVGEHVFARPVPEEVWRIDPDGATRLIARGVQFERIRARPGDDTIALLEWTPDYRLRIVDVDGHPVATVTDLPSRMTSYDFRDRDRLVVTVTAQDATQLLELTLGDDGSVQARRELGVFAPGVARLTTSANAGVAVHFDHDLGVYIAAGVGEELVRIDDGGWVGQLAGWLDADTLVVGGARMGRHAIVGISRDAAPRVLAADVDGWPFRYDGDRWVVFSGYGSGYCGLRAYQHGAVVAEVERPCEADLVARCATLTSGPCVLATSEAGQRVYRMLDPGSLTVGEVVHTAPDHGMLVTPAISLDGTQLLIPSPYGSLTTVDLATHAATQIAATSDRHEIGWFGVADLPGPRGQVVATATRDMRGGLLEIAPDGSITERGEPFDGRFLANLAVSADGTRLAANQGRLVVRLVAFDLPPTGRSVAY